MKPIGPAARRDRGGGGMRPGNCRRHRWEPAPGGCRENPGVWAIGGAAILIRHRCAVCGAERECIVGDVNVPSRNHGWRQKPPVTRNKGEP